MTGWWVQPATVRGLILGLASIGVLISSCELLVSRRSLTDGGLLSWQVASLQTKWLASGPIHRLLEPCFRYPQVLLIVLVRAAAALTIIASVLAGRSEWAGIPVLIVAASLAALLLRTPFGNDGADQMSLVIFVCLSTSFLVANNRAILTACLFFIAAQSCLSYSTSGLAKLSASGWRTGSFVPFIFGTYVYGFSAVGNLLHKSRILAFAAAWMVIIPECSFIVVLFLPWPWCLLPLIWGGVFHLSSTVLMGLNTFFWAFVATYPAILYMHDALAVNLLPM